MKSDFQKSALAFAIASSMISFAQAETTAKIEEVAVLGKSVSYANNAMTESMRDQQSSMTSVLSMVDNLPGVLINEGDTFGADDWSTTVSIRGFQLSLDEQQIGITIDGIANGNSNYGGGAKANRYIDTENLDKIEVSQGTADIASRSNEALGGTLNFTTIDPGMEEKLVVSLSSGDYDARKVFARYETGEIFANTAAWISMSRTESSDFMQQAAQNERDHYAAKLVSEQEKIRWEGYISYDDVHEDNYQRVSLSEFKQDPTWDRLTDDWTGIPYVDQSYRRGWSTLRENLFAYLKMETTVGPVDIDANVYYHDNEGRGDWVPPYIVDVTADASGNSELISGNTVYGGPALGQIMFVDAAGNKLAPISGCVSSITAPYGGAGPEYDPQCYASGALPVGSYRTTNYEKQRMGFSVDFAWKTEFDNMNNTLRGGIWYEDYERDETRSWQKIIDARTSFNFDHTPYWVQYDRTYPVETTMVYLEDTLEFGAITARLGVKDFSVDLERKDNYSGANFKVNSDSDTLVSGGIVAQMPIDGLEFFAGYAENFAAIKDEVLERDSSSLGNIEPETAENIDVGFRYQGDRINASITYYQVDFKNRLTFIAPDSPAGINYLIGTNGSYVNTGGIESDGIEASFSIDFNDTWSAYVSLTKNDSTYAGGEVDFPQGNTVFGSVEDMAVVSIDWRKEHYSAGISAKYVGDRYIDPANTQVADAYAVADFYLLTSLGSFGNVEDVIAKMVINNLTDEEYIGGVAGGWGGWIGAPRTVTFNLEVSF